MDLSPCKTADQRFFKGISDIQVYVEHFAFILFLHCGFFNIVESIFLINNNRQNSYPFQIFND